MSTPTAATSSRILIVEDPPANIQTAVVLPICRDTLSSLC